MEARYTSIFSNFDDLRFTDTPLSATVDSPELGQRGCLLKFDSPEAPTVFYVTTMATDNGGKTYFAVKRGEGELKSNYDGGAGGIARSNLGDQPICGYSVVTNTDAALGDREVGDTVVYFLAKESDGATPPVVSTRVRTLVIPTSSEDAMTDFFAETNVISTTADPTMFLNEIDDPDRNPSQLEGQNARMAASVWLGDNRSLLLPSFNTDVYFFDANNNHINFLPPPTGVTRPESANILFASRATQADKDNLGCT